MRRWWAVMVVRGCRWFGVMPWYFTEIFILPHVDPIAQVERENVRPHTLYFFFKSSRFCMNLILSKSSNIKRQWQVSTRVHVIKLIWGGVTHFVDSHLFEGDLQKLEVVDVFMLQLGTKFNFLQRHRVWKQHVHELAVGSTWTKKTRQRITSHRTSAITTRRERNRHF